MRTIHEHSAGVIPFRRPEGSALFPLYCIWSSTRRPCATRVPDGNFRREASSRVNQRGKLRRASSWRKETGIRSWAFREGSERTVTYTYIRLGRRRNKTVTYFLAEVFDGSDLKCSREHMEDPLGHWSHWGSFEQIGTMLSLAKTRRLFAEADAWLRSRDASRPSSNACCWEHANRSAVPRRTPFLPEVDEIGGPKPVTPGAMEAALGRDLSPCKAHDP